MLGSLTKFDMKWTNNVGYDSIIPTTEIFGYLCSHLEMELSMEEAFHYSLFEK